MGILLVLIFFLAPAYAIRLSLFNFPTNILMLAVFFFWLVFFSWIIIKNKVPIFFQTIKNTEIKQLTIIGLFFLSGLLGLFIPGFDRAKLGQFIVLFFQPIVTFFVAKFIFEEFPKTKKLLLGTAYDMLGIAGVIAIIQYTTLLWLPPEFWGNSLEPKRAIAFFIHPNFYALWCAPLLALLIPDLRQKIQELKKHTKYILRWTLGLVGLFLSLSRAGWLGVAAALAVYFFAAADNKIRKVILSGLVAAALIILIIPNFRYRLILPFLGEKSADSRIELWQSGIKAIRQSPVLGIGLNGYSNEYRQIQADTTLPDHNFPHNIFLDFWVETGVLGLISFIAICYLAIAKGLKDRQDIFKLGVCLFIIALLTQGQIDNPYFKNDLALVFWIIMALI